MVDLCQLFRHYGLVEDLDFGDVSSSGVAAVVVYKSANAILPTGGLGATINMVTTKPIDGKNGGGVSVRLMNHSSVEKGDSTTPEVDVVLRNGEVGDAKVGFLSIRLTPCHA